MIWLGAIFTATSIPSSFLPETDVKFADKGVHFLMYGVQALLFARAMRNPPRTTRFRVVMSAFLLVSAIGALDEWHQQYIQGRSTEFLDWMADTTGGLIGAVVWLGANRGKAPPTT